MKLKNSKTGQVEEVTMHRIGTNDNSEVVYAPADEHDLPEGFYADEDGNWVKEEK